MSDSLILPCASCATLNRVAADRIGDVPTCHDCGERLLGAPPAKLDPAALDRFVQKSSLPVVVDFWAPWCGPCRMMAPQFEQAAGPLAGTAVLGKLDTQDHPAVAASHGVSGIPTMILFQGGAEIARISGAMGAADIERWVRDQLAVHA